MSDTVAHVAEAQSPRSKMRAAHDEFMQLAQAIVRVGGQFAEALEDTTNEATSYKARVAELEAMNRSISQENRNMMAGRDDAAHRKLNHIRRVMQVLLEELGPEDNNTPRLSSYRTQSPENRDQGVPPTVNGYIPNVVHVPRQGSNRSRSPSSVTASPSPSNRQNADSRSRLTQRSPVTVQPAALRSPSTPSQDLSLVSKKAYRPQDDLWKMSYIRTPRSAEVVCPIRWAWFQERLGLDEEMVCSLESLGQMDDLCFRVQIIRDMAFVYEPFAMDGSFTSIIMDWGSPTDNLRTANYIRERLINGNVFHTFTYPAVKDPTQHRYWYYIGAHTWTITKHYPVWPELSERSKGIVIAKLGSRCQNAWPGPELRKMLDDGHLDQLCVEVSSASLRSDSEAFARNLDYSRSARKSR